MEHEKFITWLKQHAELEIVKSPATAAQRAPSEPAEIWRNGQSFVVSKDYNPTVNYKIKKLKPKTQRCEDCNLIVEDRVVIRKTYSFPETYWRTNCQNCRRTKNPETGEFDIDFDSVGAFFNSYLLNRDK